MYIGRFYYHLEEKGRTLLPKKFRETTKEWVITRGLDGGLFCFNKTNFMTQVEKLSQRTFTNKDHRDFVRLLVNDAFEVIPDKLGRVSLPAHLIDLAGLTKEIVIVGSYEYIELWDRDRYHQYLDRISTQAEVIAERLDSANATIPMIQSKKNK